MKFIIYIHLLLITLFININSHKRCGVDKIPKDYRKRVMLRQNDQSFRKTEGTIWQKLRIHFDFSFIEKNIKKINKKDYIALKDKLLPKTKEVFSQIIKVRSYKQALKLETNENCANVSVPQKYITEGVDADLIIFVKIDLTGNYVKDGIEAAAWHCFIDENTKRPIAGYIEFAPGLSFDSQPDFDYFVWLALHEITHILVFNADLLPEFVDSNTFDSLGKNKILGNYEDGGDTLTYVKTPNIIEKGKKHFNCKKFKGLLLDSRGGEGTAGNHWDRKHMNTDYMIGETYGENLISELTLAMFEDSGWYKVDYNMANMFLWGKNEGCLFSDLAGSCTDKDYNYNNEFCSELKYPVCSVSHIFRGHCKEESTSGCNLANEVKRGQAHYGGSCRYGSQQKLKDFESICSNCACFMSNIHKDNKKRLRFKQINAQIQLNNNKIDNPDSDNIQLEEREEGVDLTPDDLRAYCFKFTCKNDIVYIKLNNGKKVKCSDNGETEVEGYDGKVICPSAEVLCDKKYQCKFGCTDHYEDRIENNDDNENTDD